MSDTREYPTPRPKAAPVPWWAVSLMTILVMVNIAAWPIAIVTMWEHYH